MSCSSPTTSFQLASTPFVPPFHGTQPVAAFRSWITCLITLRFPTNSRTRSWSSRCYCFSVYIIILEVDFVDRRSAMARTYLKRMRETLIFYAASSFSHFDPESLEVSPPHLEPRSPWLRSYTRARRIAFLMSPLLHCQSSHQICVWQAMNSWIEWSAQALGFFLGQLKSSTLLSKLARVCNCLST